MYFPRPYPDELVGSMLHRAERQLGIGRETLLLRLTGHRLSSHSFLMTQYGGIAQACGMTLEDFLANHTVFPYLTAFYRNEQREQIKAQLLRSDLSLKSTASLAARAVLGEQWLRFCPVCADRELMRHGESYWHRMHQLCGVSVCSDHKVDLYETSLPISRAPRIPPPHELSNCRPLDPELAHATRVAIAMASTSTLWRNYDYDLRTAVYQRHAKELGYVYMGGKVHGALLAHDMASFYGADFLRRYGCLEGSGRKNRWPGKLLQSSSHHTTTFRHILLDVFLNSGPTPSANRIDFEDRHKPKIRDWTQIEETAIACLTAEAARHKKAGTRVNLADLYELAHIKSIVKVNKNRVPRLMAWLAEFKSSAQSNRIPGRRARI